MAAKALSMEHLKDILRLKNDGFSIKAIVRHTGLARNTVRKYLSAVNAAGIDIEGTAVRKKDLVIAYNNDTTSFKGHRYTLLKEHFCYAEKELTKTGVTKQLLWLEYKELYPDGYNYSQYCFRFNEYLRHKEVVMHLEHNVAETIMVDFAGKKLSYTDTSSGEIIECEVFIAVLPHSGMTFCKAVHSQTTGDFIDCINDMLRYYGGSAQTILCDNLKTAVIRSCRYEPLFTDMCSQLSEHYGTTFTATRPYKPRDKAMVEKSVRIVYTNCYAPIRNHTFTSIKELNYYLYQHLETLNNKPYKGSSYSRKQLFEQQEKNLLKILPTESFTIKRSVVATVQRNYHVQLSEDHKYYSVPYTYAGQKVKVLYDNKTVEIYLNHNRIALHARSYIHRAYNTIAEHMPSNHQYAIKIKGWTKDDLLAKAKDIGPATKQAFEHILSSSIYPEQNYKSCHGVLMLQNKFGKTRIEAACARVLTATRINYTMIKNILHNGLDKQPLLFDTNPLPDHDNIRGADNYQ